MHSDQPSHVCEIAGLRWTPRWTSRLGCIAACARHLGIEVTDAWIYGALGHAFIVNVTPDLCPSGPTAWDTAMLTRLGSNLGWRESAVRASRAEGEAAFARRQREAWEFVQSALDRVLPCYGWELDVPEWYVLYGCDEVGYLYSGPHADGGGGPRPWDTLGATDIGWLEVVRIEPATPAADAPTVREALRAAVLHASGTSGWTHPPYLQGAAAFEAWASALAHGHAGRFGLGYNASVWQECRSMALEFLQEAQARLSGRADALFRDAITEYTLVQRALAELRARYPFDAAAGHDGVRDIAAADLMRDAAAAEARALALLPRIADALDD